MRNYLRLLAAVLFHLALIPPATAVEPDNIIEFAGAGKADLEKAIADASLSGPVVVKIGAEWCGPCRRFDRDLRQKLAPELKGKATFIIIDKEKSPRLIAELGLHGGTIPDFNYWISQKDHSGARHIRLMKHEVGWGNGGPARLAKTLDKLSREGSMYLGNDPDYQGMVKEAARIKSNLYAIQIALMRSECMPFLDDVSAAYDRFRARLKAMPKPEPTQGLEYRQYLKLERTGYADFKQEYMEQHFDDLKRQGTMFAKPDYDRAFWACVLLGDRLAQMEQEAAEAKNVEYVVAAPPPEHRKPPTKPAAKPGGKTRR